MPSIRWFRAVTLGAFVASSAVLAPVASAQEMALQPIANPKKLSAGDAGLLFRAGVLRACMDQGSCRLSLEGETTSAPYLAFMVEEPVFEKFRDADFAMYQKTAAHLFLRLHERPASALYGKKYGGLGMGREDPRIPALAENVKNGLRRIHFFVVQRQLVDEHARLPSIPEEARTFKPELSFEWLSDNSK